MEEVRIKLLKVSLRNGDFESAMRYFKELHDPISSSVQHLIYKLACQTGVVCMYRSFFESLTLTADQIVQCCSLLCRFVEGKNDWLFFPQLTGYHVALICSMDWLNDDNNMYLNDCTIRQGILKMFKHEEVVVQGWALNIASYMLSNIENDGNMFGVINFYRTCRNFLQVCDVFHFWKLIDFIFECDASLHELKSFVTFLRRITLNREKFSSIVRASMVCLGLVLVGKIQDQTYSENSGIPLVGKSKQYDIMYTTLNTKYPIYGFYFDRKVSSMACSMMFNINALYATYAELQTPFRLRTFIEASKTECLPKISLDKVPPYLNRFFLDAPWAGAISPTCVPYIYEVRVPSHLFIAGPYSLSQTQALNAWQLFFTALESLDFFTIEICPIVNTMFYVKFPAFPLIHFASEGNVAFRFVYQIGCMLLQSPCVFEDQDVVFDAEKSLKFFSGALRLSRGVFQEIAIEGDRGVYLEVLQSIRNYFEKNKEILNLEYNVLYFKSNLWITKIEHVIAQESKKNFG